MSVCLTCGGELALFPSGHWKHTSVPEGTQPHQARRAETDRETIEARGRQLMDAAAEWNRTHPEPPRSTWTAPVEVVELTPHPPPVEPARPAFESEVPKTARAALDLLAGHGWWADLPLYSRGYKLGTLAVVENLVVRASRAASRERLVVWWEDSGYGGGYHLTPNTGPVAVNYTELRKRIIAPVMLCDTCGLPPHAHPIPRESPDCFQEER